MYGTSVAGGSTVCRVATIEVKVVQSMGSSPEKGPFIQIDRQGAGEHELAKFDANR